MTNRAKILIGIVIVILIIAIIFGFSKNKKIDNNEVQNQQEFGNVFDYINETNETENQINNVIENNVIEENIISDEKENYNNTQSNNSNVVVGKEEKESSSENTEVNNMDTAIELAKKEWAISINSYDFEAELQNDGTYIIRVRNKTTRNEVTRYTVNVKTGTVVEAE